MTALPARRVYPEAWGVELHRNYSGRAFFYVSRFINRTEVEFVTEIDGGAKCFRRERDAIAAMERANAQAAV